VIRWPSSQPQTAVIIAKMQSKQATIQHSPDVAKFRTRLSREFKQFNNCNTDSYIIFLWPWI
jgi:hypothetical protein